MLMFCTPPATTRSAVPLSTAWAAKWTACWDEPHCRSTVTPGTASGRPAASQERPDDVRAEIGGVRTGQAAAAPADRRPHGIDQVRLGHAGSPRLCF